MQIFSVHVYLAFLSSVSPVSSGEGQLLHGEMKQKSAKTCGAKTSLLIWCPRTPLIPCFLSLALAGLSQSPFMVCLFNSALKSWCSGEFCPYVLLSSSVFTHGDISPLMADYFQIRTFSLIYSSELWATHSDIPLYMFNDTLTVYRAHTTFIISPSNLLLFKRTEGPDHRLLSHRIPQHHKQATTKSQGVSFSCVCVCVWFSVFVTRSCCTCNLGWPIIYELASAS